MKPAAKSKSQKISKSDPNRLKVPSLAATAVVQTEAVMESAPVVRVSVAQRAYELWQKSACQHGKDLEHWLAAEKELLTGNSFSALN